MSTTYGQIGGAEALPELLPSNAGVAAWPTASQMRCGIFTLEEFATIRYIRMNIGVQSGNIQLGVIRLDDDPSTLTYTRVAHTGVIACPAAGDQVFDLGLVQPLSPGRYGLFFWADNTTVQVPLLTNSATQPLRLWAAQTGASGGVGASGALSAYSNRLLPVAATLT